MLDPDDVPDEDVFVRCGFMVRARFFAVCSPGHSHIHPGLTQRFCKIEISSYCSRSLAI